MALITSSNYSSPVAATYHSQDTDVYSRQDSFTGFLQCLDVHTHRTALGLGAGRLTSTAIVATANTGECAVQTGGLKITDGTTQNNLLDAAQNGYTAYKNLGLTGATSASRYVGATTSGAPISGTFAVGDFVVDQSGRMWICTVAGSPGTWKKTLITSDAVYSELGKGTATTNQNITSTASPGTDVTGLTVTCTPNGTNDVKITASLPDPGDGSGSSSHTIFCALQKDGSIVNTWTSPPANFANNVTPVVFTYIDPTPTNASHTYKLSMWLTNVGTTPTIKTINGDGTSPTNLILVEQIG